MEAEAVNGSERHHRERPPSPARLYRDTERGIFFGVAAGIADYVGIRPWAVRLGLVIAAIPFTFPLVVGYLIAGCALQPRPVGLYRSEEEAEFWRSVRTEPQRTAHDLGLKFADIERRLRQAEAHVTSREFRLRREIGEL
ncbi:MAG: envelope stress response membrane protein PspC [Alphaproteobacteria bacterium]|nr:envelope stress response membrane protein PspC [Alphaproteobacteria bacterium]